MEIDPSDHKAANLPQSIKSLLSRVKKAPEVPKLQLLPLKDPPSREQVQVEAERTFEQQAKFYMRNKTSSLYQKVSKAEREAPIERTFVRNLSHTQFPLKSSILHELNMPHKRHKSRPHLYELRK